MLSHVWLFPTPWSAACHDSLSITNSQSLFNSYPLSQWCHPTISSWLCHPLLLLSSIFLSIRDFFQWVSSSHQLAKVLEFQLQHQSFQWIFRSDILKDGLVGSPCSPRDSQEVLPAAQFKSINSLVLSFLYGPISHPYITTGKTIALTRWTFVGKVMSLLFNMLSMLILIKLFFQGACVLISWLQSPSAVILEPLKKSLSLFPLFPHLSGMKWWDWMPWS